VWGLQTLSFGGISCWGLNLLLKGDAEGNGDISLGYDKGVERGAIWRTGAGGVCD